MNLRITLPERFAIRDRHGNTTALRLECYNSVDGSSRLTIVFGWIRFICSNGLIIGETMIEIRERHDGSLELDSIPERIARSFKLVAADKAKRLAFETHPVSLKAIEHWANGPVSNAWGKKAAVRVFHICGSGYDVDFADPFASGAASKKPVFPTARVPGAPSHAATVYDVMQALSHVAGSRRDAVAQQRMLLEIDGLLRDLERAADMPYQNGCLALGLPDHKRTPPIFPTGPVPSRGPNIAIASYVGV